MDRSLRFLIAALAVTLFALGFGAVKAQAAGGNYVFDSGTAAQQKQVRKALNASAFPWSVVPEQITIHIGAGVASEAAPGEIWLDADLLDSGEFSWGVVQHEFAHEVDFFLFNDETRAQLLGRLGGSSWWGLAGSEHSSHAAERFASTLAWAYWPTSRNSMKPQSPLDESAAMAPASFRRLIAQLGIAAPISVR